MACSILGGAGRGLGPAVCWERSAHEKASLRTPNRRERGGRKDSRREQKPEVIVREKQIYLKKQ